VDIAQDSDFGGWSQIEKLYEIKPPLPIMVNEIIVKK
jgi:hypothetical protein